MSQNAEVERVRVAANGRLVIPAAYRRALGISEGGDVLLRLRDDHLEIEPASAALARLREAVRRHAGDRDLVSELIAERREEAADE